MISEISILNRIIQQLNICLVVTEILDYDVVIKFVFEMI